MLKSTHQPPRPPGGAPPLPPGWTVHTAPTGHPYYYNATTKQSTYSRPGAAPSAREQVVTHPTQHSLPHGPIHGGPPVIPPFFNVGSIAANYAPAGFSQGHFQGPQRVHHFQGGRRKRQPQDRPKSKHFLAGYEPWLLVKTKFGRRFVYHPDKGESFWKVPDQLQTAIEDFERREKEKRVAEPQYVDETESEVKNAAEEDDDDHNGSVSEEVEEVEVTDEEDEEDDENPSKRVKLGEPGAGETREFNEDDIAYQLAAMGQDDGVDPAEYGDGRDGEYEEDMHEAPLTEEEVTGLFKDMLDDHGINPYSTWEKIIQEGKIIEDERYTVLPNMKARKEVWGEWSRDKIRVLKEQRAKAEARNPLLPYLAFLECNASVKLYWPEFKRKFKSAPEMRDAKLSDKQREKWYRDYISRLKLPESALKSDFSALLKSQPLNVLNRSTQPSLLPENILTDIRWLSPNSTKREELLEVFIATLGPPPAGSTEVSPGEREEISKQQEARDRRRQALIEREARIAAEKRRQGQARRLGRERLHEEEAAVAQAMRVGREGLRTQLGLQSTEHANT